MHGEHGEQPNHAKLYGIIGLVAGVLLGIGIAAYSVNTGMTGMMRMMGISGGMMGDNDMMDHADPSHSMMNMSMSDMMDELSSVTGEERDKAFLQMMIAHHEGAIEMAESVKKTTMRDELKTMADDIIAAQSREIEQMKTWQQQWGYAQ